MKLSANAPKVSAANALGIVVSAHGRHAVVEGADGVRVHCHTRGKRSDVVVGDRVHWRVSGDQGVIESIAPRRNLLHRQDEWRSKSFAANIDQVLVLVAVEPIFGDEQLTRSLIAIADAGLPAHIICNKIDLPRADATLQRLEPYRAADVDITSMALKRDAAHSRNILAPMLAGRVTLVMGPSGVGKSSLINLMVPDAAAQVGELSVALQAGRHTTTATRWYWLNHARAHGFEHGDTTANGALIDSPGFQQFGLHHIPPDRVTALMPDIQAHAQRCKFYNCTHRHEPGCGVLEALSDGQLDARRHAMYVQLRHEAEAAQQKG